MKIVTGYRGTAHISSKDDQGRNRGLVGADSYVLGGANEFSATLVSNNELQIGPGEGILQGVHFRVEPGSYDSLTIENGSQGMQRKDLVVCRYTKDSSTGVEGTEWVVIKGTAVSSNPVRPSYTSGDVASGALVADMPFYEIVINGINVTAVNPLFSVLKTMQELKAQQDTNTSAIAALNSSTAQIENRYTWDNSFSSGKSLSLPSSGNGAFMLYGYLQGYSQCAVIVITLIGGTITMWDVCGNKTMGAPLSASYSNSKLTVTTSNTAPSRVVLTAL